MWTWWFFSAWGSAADAVQTERLTLLGTSQQRMVLLAVSQQRATLLGTSQ